MERLRARRVALWLSVLLDELARLRDEPLGRKDVRAVHGGFSNDVLPFVLLFVGFNMRFS